MRTEEYRETQRAYQRRRHRKARGRCVRCGGPLGIGSLTNGEPRVTNVCAGCISTARQERQERIQRRWREGATMRVIAEELGSTPGAIGGEMVRMRSEGWDLPPRYARNREKARQAAYRATHRSERRGYDRARMRRRRRRCLGCGGLMGGSGGRSDGDVGLCSSCRGEQREERRRLIEALWSAGLSLKEIAYALASTPGAVGVEMTRMRELGSYDLGARYRRHRGPPRSINRRRGGSGDGEALRVLRGASDALRLDEVYGRGDFAISRGGLYRALQRLEAAGLVRCVRDSGPLGPRVRWCPAV